MRTISSYGQVLEARGSASDAGIFSECSIRTTLNDSIDFPPAEPFPQNDRDVPYFMLGDDATPPPPHTNLADETLLHERYDSRTESVQAVQSPTCCGKRLWHLGAPVEVFADGHVMQRCQYYQHCLGCFNTAQLDADQDTGPSAARGWPGGWARWRLSECLRSRTSAFWWTAAERSPHYTWC